MIDYISDRLVIIGTSHIAKESVKEIKKTFEEFKPDVIAIELDKSRLQKLLSNEKPTTPGLGAIKQFGLSGYLFMIIGAFAQRKLGGLVDVEPGADMKSAYLVAKENKTKILLADQPITITLKNISKKWSRKEKFKIFLDLFRRKKVSINIKGVPKNLDKIIRIFKDEYPSLYQVLVEDRNIYMVKVIKNYQKRFPDQKIMLVIGAGHLEGIKKLI